MHYTKIWLLCALLPGAAYAGQSLVLTTATVNTSVIDPTYAQNRSWRVEFQIHNWTLPPANVFNARIAGLTGVGFNASLFPDGRLSLEDDRDDISPRQPCFVSTAGISNALVRLQRDLSLKLVTCEVWNYDGTGYNSSTETINFTNTWTTSGGTLGGNLAVDLAFLRVFTTTVPLGSKPPTTADGGDWTELKFDGNLNDSSGNGHNATDPGATYVNTPNQGVTAFPRTLGAPAFSSWTSLRAGYPAQLDGTASYSLADASSSVSYFWRQVSGPTQLQWNSHTAARPTISGLTFGTYTFSLQVTDVALNVASATLQAAAVAYDDNGIVIPSSPSTSGVFGPQIAFGQNPWGYADQLQYQMIGLQTTYQATANDFSWTTVGSGTIRYPFSGIGFTPGTPIPGTTITSNISASATSIPIANASVLNNGSGLTTGALPTWLLIGANTAAVIGNQFEMVRITQCTSVATGLACVAGTTAATLTVAFDGRGMSGNGNQGGGVSSPGAAASWLSGAVVGELRIQGTGTHFSTDSSKPFCPAGVPGPPGAVVYSAGTVTLSAGSVTVTGNGTAWTTAMGVQSLGANFIRVSATHNGGTPFVFWGQITAYTSFPYGINVDAQTLNLNRPAPTGTDSGTFSYVITSDPFLSLEMNAPTDGHVIRLLYNGMGCESDTAMFSVASHDIPALDGTMQPTTGSIHYSYKTFLSEITNTGTYDPNFYGTGLAARNFFLRSGYTPALTLANSIDEYWVRDPQLGDGYAGGDPLSYGGGVIGAIMDLITNSSTVLTWPNVEQYAYSAEVQLLGASPPSSNPATWAVCNILDSRETGVLSSILALAATYDTNSTNAAAFTTALGYLMTRQQTCRRNASDGYVGAEVNSFSNSFAWNPASVGTSSPSALTLTNGSTAVTGTGLTQGTSTVAGYCYGVDVITLTVTSGSSIAVVASGSLTLTLPAYHETFIYFYDGSKVGVFVYSGSGGVGTTIQLSSIWTGASGTFPAMSSPGPDQTAGSGFLQGYGSIWTSNAESLTNNQALEKVWACKTNSSTSATLFRPWDGPNGSNYYISYYTIGAFGQEAFMIGGYLENSLRFGSLSANSAIASGFAAILPQVGAWYNSYGWDPNNSRGSTYNTVYQACAPQSALLVGGFGFDSIAGYEGCAPNGAPQAARVDSAEGGMAMLQWYLASPTQTNRATVDNFYGAMFAYPPNCSSSVASTCADGLFASPNNMNATKWPGFYFGMGGFFTMSWPAVRNGPVQAARLRTVYIGFSLGSAASVRVTVSAPSGQVTTVACTSAPCAVTVDDRQGSFWYQVQYLSSAGQVVATADPVLLPLPPQS